MKKIFLLLSFILLLHVVGATSYISYDPFWKKAYVTYKVSNPIEIDGDIYTPEWQKAKWTEDFVDISGDNVDNTPKYRTRAKMLWDDHFLYIAVEMEEPHIWANKNKRDDTIYWDNDIEFFIDPSCLGQHYKEFEFNAFNTAWDILISKPPFRGGQYAFGWDAKKMKTAVKYYGTVNDPSDVDQKWTFEAAVPFDDMGYVFPGIQWKFNLSRVEWLHVDVKDGKYVKQEGYNRMGMEENWVWCPTGVVDIHRPERWGWLQFSGITIGEGEEEFNWNNDYQYKELLWTVSNRIQQYRYQNKKLPESLNDIELDGVDSVLYQKIIEDNDYIISTKGTLGIYSIIGSDGYMRVIRNKQDVNPRPRRKSSHNNPGYKIDTVKLMKRMFY